MRSFFKINTAVLCGMALALSSCGNKVKPNYNISDEELNAQAQAFLSKARKELPKFVDDLGTLRAVEYDSRRKTMVWFYELGWGVPLTFVLNRNPAYAKYRMVYKISISGNTHAMARLGIDLEEVYCYSNYKENREDTVSVILTNAEMRRSIEDTRYRDSASVVWLAEVNNCENAGKRKPKVRYILNDTVENNCLVRNIVVCRHSVFEGYKTMTDEMALEEIRGNSCRDYIGLLNNAGLDFVARYIDARTGEVVEGRVPYKALPH